MLYGKFKLIHNLNLNIIYIEYNIILYLQQQQQQKLFIT